MNSVTMPTLALGCFRVGALWLALPASALREVVAITTCTPLPSSAHFVVGGMLLRGLTIPVIDLLSVVGQRRDADAKPDRVVVVRRGNRLIGLLCDEASEVIEVNPTELRGYGVGEADETLVTATFTHGDHQSPLCLINEAGLFSLPQMPHAVAEEEVAPEIQLEEKESLDEDETFPVLLMRCGSVPLGIDAMMIMSAISSPVVHESPLALGVCRGVIEFLGHRIPAVDLQALCGWGSRQSDTAAQAVVLRHDGGLVACLVDDVLDVARVRRSDVLVVPSFSLARPDLFGGAIAWSQLQRFGASNGSNDPRWRQLLLMDASRLARCPELLPLISLSKTTEAPEGLIDESHAEAPDEDILVLFSAHRDYAVRAAQVVEITQGQIDLSTPGKDDAFIGYQLHRDCSVPVVSLRRLEGNPFESDAQPGPVLLVRAHGSLIGFMVDSLKGIERSSWSPTMRCEGQSRAQMALVPSAKGSQVVQRLDLQALADELVQS
jgi:purine-binding chemotaxis protein CheW